MSALDEGQVRDADGVRSVVEIERAWHGLQDAMAVSTIGLEGRPPVIAAANPAFCELFEVTADDVRGAPLLPYLSAHDARLFERTRSALVKAGESLTDFVVVRDESGVARVVEWELAPVRDESGETTALIAVLRDVTTSVVRRPLGSGADVDPTTGLPNQNHFMSRLERSVERATTARAYGFAVMGLEAEGLQTVEQRLGPAFASTVVEALVRRIRPCLRPGDLIARVGNDWLAILLDHFDGAASVERVLERVCDAVDAPYTIAGETIELRTHGVPGPVCDPAHLPVDAHQVMDELERSARHARFRTGAAKR